VHVVDKATKLQTIYDRIDLIDTRFEVIRRDAEVRKWRSIAEGADRLEAEEAHILIFAKKLPADRSILRQANIGSEKMAAEDIAQVRRIAETYRWRNPEGVEQPFLSADELENLTIPSGTLTPPSATSSTTTSSPPSGCSNSSPGRRHLKNVPEYAGGHHERMDGKGYPKA
jgi:hypothetical protein